MLFQDHRAVLIVDSMANEPFRIMWKVKDHCEESPLSPTIRILLPQSQTTQASDPPQALFLNVKPVRSGVIIFPQIEWHPAPLTKPLPCHPSPPRSILHEGLFNRTFYLDEGRGSQYFMNEGPSPLPPMCPH